jgi:hypothetical protein
MTEKRTKYEVRAIRDAFLKDYRDVIDRIMSVLDFEESERMELEFTVVLALQRAVRFAMNRTGKVYSPREVSLYKIANILHDVKTWEEYKTRIKKAIPKEKPEHTLYMYKELTFKVPFDMPDDNKGKKHKKEKEEVQFQLPPLVGAEPEDALGMYTNAVEQNFIDLQNAVTKLAEENNVLRGRFNIALARITKLEDDLMELRAPRPEKDREESLDEELHIIHTNIDSLFSNFRTVHNDLEAHFHYEGKVAIPLKRG